MEVSDDDDDDESPVAAELSGAVGSFEANATTGAGSLAAVVDAGAEAVCELPVSAVVLSAGDAPTLASAITGEPVSRVSPAGVAPGAVGVVSVDEAAEVSTTVMSVVVPGSVICAVSPVPPVAMSEPAVPAVSGVPAASVPVASVVVVLAGLVVDWGGAAAAAAAALVAVVVSVVEAVAAGASIVVEPAAVVPGVSPPPLVLSAPPFALLFEFLVVFDLDMVTTPVGGLVDFCFCVKSI